MTVSERLESRSVPEPNTGCLLWLGNATPLGYGMIKIGGRDGRKLYAHRVAYELAKGPIPAGTEIDHLCRVACCINPAHLEAVAHGVNVRRGNSPGAISARIKRCKRGHDLSVEGQLTARGTRRCRACRRVAS